MKLNLLSRMTSQAEASRCVPHATQPSTETEVSEASTEVPPKKPKWWAKDRTAERATPEWVGASERFTVLVTWALRASVIAGPLALLLVMGALTSQPRDTAVRPPATPAGASAHQQEAGEVGRQLVTAWLTGTQGEEKTLQEMLDDDSLVVALPRSQPAVRDIVVMSTASQSEHVWSVKVSALVGPGGKAVRRYFQVPVGADEHGFAGLTLPSPVAGPQYGLTVAAVADYSGQVTVQGPLGQTVAGFLTAMLTGQETDRYVAPTVDPIAPITPAPYRSVRVTTLAATRDVTDEPPADGDTAHVLVTVAAATSSAATTQIQYTLALSASSGRWEVTSLDPSPRT